MGCIGLLGMVPSSHGPVHPITSLYGDITTPRRPITKIGTPHCTITNSKMTHLTGSAPYDTEELVDIIIIKMCASIAKITLLKLPVHRPEATSIQTNESIISQICIASERAAALIQNTSRQHPFKVLGAFVLLSALVSHLDIQQLFKKEKMEGDKKPPMCTFHSNFKENIVF